ncbi:MAG: helix-turn-helix transcriptional regulator [Clostridia bacterium]|nr:helix-turn-helix transcriptional regulator [Clostridia bacterium]
MGRRINMNDLHIKLHFDELHITVEQLNYGIFHSSITRHCHGKNYYEAHLVSNGKGTLIAEGKEYPLEKGSLYMTGPNITHEQLTDRTTLMEEYCLGFDIKKKKNSCGSEASEVLRATSFWIGKDNGEAEKMFEALSAESLIRSIGYQNNMKNTVSSLLVHLVRSYTGNAASIEKHSVAPDDRRAIVTDVSFLYDYKTITLGGLAKTLGLSERQLQRFLAAQYGKTFSQLKREARFNKATELLNSGLSCEEAAAGVGYEDMRSFRKLFEKEE